VVLGLVIMNRKMSKKIPRYVNSQQVRQAFLLFILIIQFSSVINEN